MDGRLWLTSQFNTHKGNKYRYSLMCVCLFLMWHVMKGHSLPQIIFWFNPFVRPHYGNRRHTAAERWSWTCSFQCRRTVSAWQQIPFPQLGIQYCECTCSNGILYHCNIDHLASVWFLSLFFMVTSHFTSRVKAEQVLYVKVNIWTTKTINTSHLDQNIALSKMP